MCDYLCNLLMPGAAKSGTSSLFSALAEIDEVSQASPKEPQFFSSAERFAGGAAAHNAYFSPDKERARYYCDASQSYFADPIALSRIRSSLSRPKIIIMLRHPIDRLLSHYRWAVRSGMENETLEQAIASRGERTDYYYLPRSNAFWSHGGYLAFSRYTKHLPMWLEAFPDSDMHVIKAERFFESPSVEMRSVLDFLGLEPTDQITMRRNNATTTTRLREPPLFLSRAAALLPQSLREAKRYRRIKDRALQAISPKLPTRLDPDMLRMLEDELAADIAFHDAL